MSYYGSAIATIAALMEAWCLFPTIMGNKYYPIPYDLKGLSRYPYFFQPYHFMVSESIMLESVY
jgi:hypothetical protein